MTVVGVKPFCTDWLRQFHAQLSRAIDLGEPSLDAVAAELIMSRRTLQRRLADLGTTWRIELDAMRQHRAEDARRSGPRGMDALARYIGYSDARSLRRARRRWTSPAP